MRTYKRSAATPRTNGTFYAAKDFADEEFWGVNFPKFTAIARRRMATLLRYRGAGGQEPADYVLKAAELLLSGRRRCRQQYSREACVYGILDSLISHDSDGT